MPPDLCEITCTDMPINTRLSFRVNDQNSGDESPTGAVTRNVFANDARVIQNTTSPRNGDEPGYALAVAGTGRSLIVALSTSSTLIGGLPRDFCRVRGKVLNVGRPTAENARNFRMDDGAQMAPVLPLPV